MTKRRLFSLIKVLASLLLVGYIVHTVDGQALWTAVTEANVTLLGAAFLMHGIGYLVSAYRWQRLLKALGYRVPVRFLINSYFVATFFNNFLPTTIGGDTVRAYDTGRYLQLPMTQTLGIVAVDRLTGLFALFLASLAAFIIGVDLFSKDLAIGLTLAIMAGLFLIIGLFFNYKVTNKFAPRFEKLLTLPIISKVAHKSQRFIQGILIYREHRHELGISILIALVLQVNVVIHYYLISVALHQQVPLLYFFLIIPIMIAVLQVAPSINGIGYREAGFVLFLGKSGVTAASAVTLSLIAFGMTVLLSVIGGIVFMLRKEQINLNILKSQQSVQSSEI